MSKESLYLEDLPVGRRFKSAEHSIDERQIKAFASAFDPLRLNVTSGRPIAGGIVGLGGDLSWPKPVRPGDVLHVESEVVEVIPSRSRPDRGTVVVRSETRNGRGEVVQITTAKLLVPRRERAA